MANSRKSAWREAAAGDGCAPGAPRVPASDGAGLGCLLVTMENLGGLPWVGTVSWRFWGAEKRSSSKLSWPLCGLAWVSAVGTTAFASPGVPTDFESSEVSAA